MSGLGEETSRPSEGETSEYPVLLSYPEQWRMKALFVLGGFANAGDLYIEVHTNADSIAAETQMAANELRQLGLIVDTRMERNGIGTVLFANSQNNLSELRSLGEHSSSKDYGELYGIPKTAIVAYPRKVMQDRQLPANITTHPLFETLPFLPSKDHYKEEWNEFVSRAKSINETMPDKVKALGLKELF